MSTAGQRAQAPIPRSKENDVMKRFLTSPVIGPVQHWHFFLIMGAFWVTLSIVGFTALAGATGHNAHSPTPGTATIQAPPTPPPVDKPRDVRVRRIRDVINDSAASAFGAE